jgi:signal transduction histidine kinase
MRSEVGRSERSLRSFVSSAAHELRTPLTSIEGFSQALLDGTAVTPDEHQRSAAAIYREAGRLRRMVDALLKLSRFDSREFRPMVMQFDAGRLLDEEVQRLVDAGVAPAGRVEVRGAGDAQVVTDQDMLRQVVANLLRNAVQYGGDDPVIAEAQTSDGFLRLRVTNGGTPILPDDRARVFERFYRGRSSYRSEGFGLGLPLVREICEVLGGGIELVGPGPSTTFAVTLPAAPVGPPPQAPGPHPELPE